MAKRFTETGKWTDVWFRRLSPTEKLLFLWLVDNCDNAGFWEVDLELAAFHIGVEQEELEGALKGLARAYVRQGNTLWLNKFLKVQGNLPLNPNNHAHRQILNLLETRPGWDFDAQNGKVLARGLLGASEGLTEGLLRPISNSTSNGKGNGNGKGGVGGKSFTLEDVINASCLVGIDDAKAKDFFHHYNAQGWRLGNGQPIADLPSAIARWRNNQYRFESKAKPRRSVEERLADAGGVE